ncbi:hypothetical protein TNCV_551271 [Trichonephila clavipes]|nr:hypothetical protein TNCV_551271 [Trichonephila clavipes]
MRVIRRGYSSAKKQCITLNMPCVTKVAYRLCEEKLLDPVTSTVKHAMNDAALEKVWKKAAQSSLGFVYLLQNLISGMSDVLRDDFSDEEMPTNNLLVFS